MMDYNQRDIVILSFNPKKGDEVGKIRPAVIISADEENSELDTIIVMPLSTQLIDDAVPYRMRVRKRESLTYDSDILINHIRTISKVRVGKKIATLSKDEYQKLIQYLCNNFSS